MDTNEHTELGNALRFSDWDDVLKKNPYISFDEQGMMHLNLQGLAENELPEQTDLVVSAGVVIGMSGDYFGGKEVEMNLPTQTEFKKNRKSYDTSYICEHLGDYLVNEPITAAEEEKLVKSYRRLANPAVHMDEIDTIYKINNANYIPFSSNLNEYVQQLMFALRIKNYGEILSRNMSHFTPWSVRAYILGHHIALKYARVSFELNQLANNPKYQSDNEYFNTLIAVLKQNEEDVSDEQLIDLTHRYQALALGMELFCFHYYTDHFAAGHGALLGDLRVLLPQRFGVFGGILVNNLHDELNRVTVYTRRPYDPNSDTLEPPVETGGDGDFNNPNNYFNKLSCIAGMQESLADIHQVFQGMTIPKQPQYGGLAKMPDIDIKYRQPQPLFLLGEDNKIYYRTELSKIRILSPSDMKAAYDSPKAHGYTELTNSFTAFFLVAKLRVLSYFYEGQLQPLTADELARIEEEERQLNPGRKPIPQPPKVQVGQEPVAVPQWQKPAIPSVVMKSLHRNSLLSASSNNIHVDDLADQIEPVSLGM